MISPSIRPILERLAFVCYLAVLVSSIGVTALGSIMGAATGNYTALWAAMGGLALSRWLHLHGHARWHFRECENSFNVLGAPDVMPRTESDEALAVELAALFTRLETEDDVWTRGDVRREIAMRLSAAPSLRADFADALAAHPEL